MAYFLERLCRYPILMLIVAGVIIGPMSMLLGIMFSGGSSDPYDYDHDSLSWHDAYQPKPKPKPKINRREL